MITETSLEEMKNSNVWNGEIFPPTNEHNYTSGSGPHTDGVRFDDVEEVLGSVEGENDGPDWVGVFKLKDGRFMVVRAGCDYTGFGCRDGGSSDFSDDIRHLERYCLTDDERFRLGVKLGEE